MNTNIENLKKQKRANEIREEIQALRKHSKELFGKIVVFELKAIDSLNDKQLAQLELVKGNLNELKVRNKKYNEAIRKRNLAFEVIDSNDMRIKELQNEVR